MKMNKTLITRALSLPALILTALLPLAPKAHAQGQSHAHVLEMPREYEARMARMRAMRSASPAAISAAREEFKTSMTTMESEARTAEDKAESLRDDLKELKKKRENGELALPIAEAGLRLVEQFGANNPAAIRQARQSVDQVRATLALQDAAIRAKERDYEAASDRASRFKQQLRDSEAQLALFNDAYEKAVKAAATAATVEPEGGQTTRASTENRNTPPPPEVSGTSGPRWIRFGADHKNDAPAYPQRPVIRFGKQADEAPAPNPAPPQTSHESIAPPPEQTVLPSLEDLRRLQVNPYEYAAQRGLTIPRGSDPVVTQKERAEVSEKLAGWGGKAGETWDAFVSQFDGKGEEYRRTFAIEFARTTARTGRAEDGVEAGALKTGLRFIQDVGNKGTTYAIDQLPPEDAKKLRALRLPVSMLGLSKGTFFGVWRNMQEAYGDLMEKDIFNDMRRTGENIGK